MLIYIACCRRYRLLHKCLHAHVIYSQISWRPTSQYRPSYYLLILKFILWRYVEDNLSIFTVWLRFVVLRLMPPDSSIDLWRPFAWGYEPVTLLWQSVMTDMLQFIYCYTCCRNWKVRKYYFWTKTFMSGGLICLQIWGRIDTIRRVIKTFNSWKSSISYDARR